MSFIFILTPMEDNLTETFETMHSLIDKIEEKQEGITDEERCI